MYFFFSLIITNLHYFSDQNFEKVIYVQLPIYSFIKKTKTITEKVTKVYLKCNRELYVKYNQKKMEFFV